MDRIEWRVVLLGAHPESKSDVCFFRWAETSLVALDSAREAFQRQHGYWPQGPAVVKPVEMSHQHG